METKLCPTCNNVVPVNLFHKAKRARDGLNWQCNSCHQARMREQIKRNASKIVENIHEGIKRCSTCKETKPKSGFNRNKGTVSGLCYECRDCERVKENAIKVRNFERHRNNPPTFSDDATKRCSGCKETLPVAMFTNDFSKTDGLKTICKSCSRIIGKAWRVNNPEKSMFYSAKKGSKQRGLEFAITLDDIKITETCPIFGFKLTHEGKRSTSASLDRIDNTKGYIPGNVVVISMKANHVKSDCTIDELRKMVEFYDSIMK